MPKGRLLPAAIAVLAVAALAVAVWLRPRPAPPPEITRFQIFAPPGSSLPLGTPAPSPDGRTLAFTVRGPDGVVRLAVRRLDSTELRLLPGTENAKHPFWSPDGRSLGFAAVSDLKRIDLAGGTPRILASTPGPWQGSWGQPGSQSGVILFQPESKDVAQIPADGGTATPAVTTDPKKGELRAIFPVFLSDGKRFLALVLHADGSGDVELGSLGSMERTVVVSRVLSAPMLAPTPDGRTWLLYLRDSALMAQEFDERTGTVRGSPNLLLDRIGHLGTSVHRVSAGVSPQGVLAYQALAWNSATGGLVWFDRSGKRLSQLPPESTGFGPSLSPDGRLLAIQRGSDAGADVWLVDLARQAATRFTLPKDGVTTRAIRFPLWSPDGERLAYGCAGGGVCVKDANGIGRQLQLSSQPAITPLAWSPDGGQILYREDATNRLAWLRLDGQPAAPFPLEIDGMISGVHFSPDGKYLAFASSESGREEVYVEAMPPGVGKWQVSVDGGEQPTWRRDGRELFFLAPDAKMMAVDIGAGQQFSPGIPHALFQSQATASQFVRNYDVTPDGQRFIVALATSDLADQPITVVLNWWAALDRK
jgi:Tol biopolymer transport system component